MASPVVGRVVSGRADATREEPANKWTIPNPLAAFTDEQLLDFAAAHLVGAGAREAELVRLFRALSAADRDRVLGPARAVTAWEGGNLRLHPSGGARGHAGGVTGAASGSTTGLAGLPDGVSEPPTDDR